MSSANCSSTNASTETLIAEDWVRHFGAISYGLLAGTSLAMNLLLAIVFIKGCRNFRRTPFYAIAWQLVLCDLCAQLIQLGIAVPITWTGQFVYGTFELFFGVLFFDTVAYNSTLLFSALMTLSRLAVFFSARANRIFFTGNGQFCSIGTFWLLVFGYVIGTNLTGCRKSFSETGFYLFHECTPPEATPTIGLLLREGSALASFYLPVLMLLAYLILFLHIRRHYRVTSHQLPVAMAANNAGSEVSERAKLRKKEVAFLLQSFLICSVLEIQDLAFLTRFPPNGQFTFFITFAQNWICILLNTIGPITLFSFNTDVRNICRQLVLHDSKVLFTRTTRF